MKLSFKWFGVRRTLRRSTKEVSRRTLCAESGFLSTGKKLIDTSHPAYKKVSQVRSQALQYFRLRSLPFPEAGIRLIRNRDLEELSQRMNEYREELVSAVANCSSSFGSSRPRPGKGSEAYLSNPIIRSRLPTI